MPHHLHYHVLNNTQSSPNSSVLPPNSRSSCLVSSLPFYVTSFKSVSSLHSLSDAVTEDHHHRRTVEVMASTISHPLRIFSIHQSGSALSSSSKGHVGKHAPAIPNAVVSGPRQLLFFLTVPPALTARERLFAAQDIPLFGLWKSLKKVEEEAEVIVREGFEAADKGLQMAERGIETAENGIEAAERGIESAEKEIASVVSFGALEQAGIVAGAEVLGVLLATTVVSSILGPEAQRS